MTAKQKQTEERTRYLDKVSFEEAKEIFFDALSKEGFFVADEERIDVRKSLGRVTSRDVVARRDFPHFPSSAMDGIAVKHEQTKGARGDNPLRIRDFKYIDTGQRVPEGFDAVIMIEEIEVFGDEVEIYESAVPGQNIREVGEDFKKGEVILKKNCVITPEAVAACLNCGNLEIYVKRPPSGVFIPTGSELTSPEEVGEEEVPESNSYIFKGYVRQWGGEAVVWPIVADVYEPIKEAVEKAVEEFDFIVISAGTSKGREDFTAKVVEELGRVLVHGVGISPGKPVLLGIIGKKPIIGLPGYPVAAWVCIDQFIRPMLERYFGCLLSKELRIKGILARHISSSLGVREFVRVRVEKRGEKCIVHPLPGGSSKLSSLVRADGILEVPEEREGFSKGEEVEVKLLEPIDQILSG